MFSKLLNIHSFINSPPHRGEGFIGMAIVCPLSFRLSCRLYVSQFVTLSCPFHISYTLWRIFNKLWSNVHLTKATCRTHQPAMPDQGHTSNQLYKGFPWFTGSYWPIRFDFTTVPYGDSGKSGLALQLFPLETIVTSNLIGQNKHIVQWKCFIQLDAEGQQFVSLFSCPLQSPNLLNPSQMFTLLRSRAEPMSQPCWIKVKFKVTLEG